MWYCLGLWKYGQLKLFSIPKTNAVPPSSCACLREGLASQTGLVVVLRNQGPHLFLQQTWVSDYLIPKWLLHSAADKIVLNARNKAVQRKEKET